MSDLTPHVIQHYGWKPDLPDQRDRKLSVAPSQLVALPELIDLRASMPPVYDQGALGSCTANAIAAAVEYERKAQNLPDIMPSRLFIYYGEREIEGTINEDAGAMIRDGVKVVASLGAPAEADWQYDISKFTVKPPPLAYANAQKDLVTEYLSVPQDSTQIEACLAAGYPIIIGFSVYASFESAEAARTGVIGMPSQSESLLGGHAVLVVGYHRQAQTWLVRNSWGASWGMGGYFTMPYGYLLNPDLASDFWTIRAVKA